MEITGILAQGKQKQAAPSCLARGRASCRALLCLDSGLCPRVKGCPALQSPQIQWDVFSIALTPRHEKHAFFSPEIILFLGPNWATESITEGKFHQQFESQ